MRCTECWLSWHDTQTYILISSHTHKKKPGCNRRHLDLDFLPCWIKNLKVKLISLVKLQGLSVWCVYLSRCVNSSVPLYEPSKSISLCLFFILTKHQVEDSDNENRRLIRTINAQETPSPGGQSLSQWAPAADSYLTENIPKYSNDFTKCVSRQVVFTSVYCIQRWWDPWGGTPLITSEAERQFFSTCNTSDTGRRSQRAAPKSISRHWLFFNIYNNEENVRYQCRTVLHITSDITREAEAKCSKHIIRSYGSHTVSTSFYR